MTDIAQYDGPAFKEQVFPNSSMIERVKYDFAMNTLIITFKTNNTVYSFFDVPREQAMPLFSEPSVGVAFTRLIKGRYNFNKRNK